MSHLRNSSDFGGPPRRKKTVLIFPRAASLSACTCCSLTVALRTHFWLLDCVASGLRSSANSSRQRALRRCSTQIGGLSGSTRKRLSSVLRFISANAGSRCPCVACAHVHALPSLAPGLPLAFFSNALQPILAVTGFPALVHACRCFAQATVLPTDQVCRVVITLLDYSE